MLPAMTVTTKTILPQTLLLDRYLAPIGTMLTVVDEEGYVRALDWQDHEPRMRRLLRLHYGTPSVEERRGALPVTVREALDRYFAGEAAALDAVEVRTGGTAFQREVWRALRSIPAGQTASYGELAHRIGRPSAVRAVGMANGSNPVGVIVPCHRVIGADGTLTGYGGGIERKRWLLRHEGAAFRE